MLKQEPPLLLVCDSSEDREAFVGAFKRVGLANPIHCRANGNDALDFIYLRGAYADAPLAPRPAVILLDLDLPSAREVVVEIKQDPSLQLIPVVVLTTSTDAQEINNCYQAGANCCIRKPIDSEALLLMVQRFTDW
jgi:CheY-like chemotaxis protein